jgi:hypothetical protein
MMDSKQLMRTSGYTEKGPIRGIGRKKIYIIVDEQPSTLGVPNFKKSLGRQGSIEVITKHSTEGIHQWPPWLQD